MPRKPILSDAKGIERAMIETAYAVHLTLFSRDWGSKGNPSLEDFRNYVSKATQPLCPSAAHLLARWPKWKITSSPAYTVLRFAADVQGYIFGQELPPPRQNDYKTWLSDLQSVLESHVGITPETPLVQRPSRLFDNNSTQTLEKEAGRILARISTLTPADVEKIYRECVELDILPIGSR